MKWLLAACIAAQTLPAGTIHGMILEYATGLPLARAKVYLEVVDAGGIRRIESVYSARGGQFNFGDRPDGAYLVSAERETYAVASHGQRRPEGFGTPFAVTRDSHHFIELRLHKLGVITGTARDENGAGIAGVRVYAYPRRLPARALASGTSDDRGVYRIHSLPPGKYWIRNGAHLFNETGDGLVPTYAPEIVSTNGARVFDARLDTETAYADIRPLPGRLLSVRGSIAPCGGPVPVTVTLSTEEGNRTTQTVCGGAFSFESVADGPRDLAATAQTPECLSYFEDLRQSGREALIQLQECASVAISRQPRGGEMQTLLRRRDLGVVGPWMDLATLAGFRLPPGYWEISARVAAKEYVSGVSQPMNRREPGPEAYTMFVPMGKNSAANLTVRVADGAAVISGVVRKDGNGVAAAPVFLWPLTDTARRALGGGRSLRAGPDGRFRFEGLAPGSYRVLSSYDFREVDEDVMELAGKLVVLTAGQTETLVLAAFESR